MAVRGVGGWRVVADCAVRVVCGVDPTRKAQQSLSCESDTTFAIVPRRVSISRSGDGGLRCQAATLTAVRETAAGEMRRSEDSRAALRDSFDCVSNEEGGSEAFRFLSVTMAGSSVDEQRRVYYGRRGGGDWYPGLLTAPKPVQEEETPVMGKREVIASFEAALQEAGRNAEMIASLAARAWRNLDDADKAEVLYMKALELAPEDSAIKASYAEFLWQCGV